jgi:serine protease Do
MNKQKFAKAMLSALALSAGLVLVAPALPGAYSSAHAATAALAGLPDFGDLVEKSGPAVVNIRTTGKARASAGEEAEMREFFRRFFGVPVPAPGDKADPHSNQVPESPQEQEPQQVPRGVGSGFIVSADGYVLTNAHVVDGADEVYVKLSDRREFKARVVGLDARTDVAVLKIPAAGLPQLAIGSSAKTRVGEWVIAIGSPFDLENSVSAGIVSAKSRETGDFLPLLQTDVAVNPGNSGGPLINLRGEVVGINSQIYSRSGGYMGISFAIPIEEAMRVADQLRSTGHVTRGRLGVYLADVGKDIAESLGLPQAQGGLVGRVERGGPADQAGLRDGDIILKFDGTAVERSAQLRRLAAAAAPGTRVDLSVWRNGAVRQVAVTVAELEQGKAPQREVPAAKPPAPAKPLGLSVAPLGEAQKTALGGRTGVVVETAEGAAARAGLRPGDIILAIDQADVASAQAFAAQAARAVPGKPVVLLVRRGDSSRYVVLRPGVAQDAAPTK